MVKEEKKSLILAGAEKNIKPWTKTIESGIANVVEPKKENKLKLKAKAKEDIESGITNVVEPKKEAEINLDEGGNKEDKNESGGTTDVSKLSEDKVVPEVTLIDLAHAKAKEVFDIGFHLAISQALLFFQHRNCEIDETAFVNTFIPGLTNSTSDVANLWDLYDCNVPFELKQLSKEMQISIAIAAYGAISGVAVVLHAVFMKNQDEPPIQGIFDWTDRIPVIDSLLEIPFCLWVAPFFTLFLWAAYLLCCTGLIILVISYQKEMYENGNLSAFALTACLVGFDLYRLTGNIAQYYVINKSADVRDRKRDRAIIEKLVRMNK